MTMENWIAQLNAFSELGVSVHHAAAADLLSISKGATLSKPPESGWQTSQVRERLNTTARKPLNGNGAERAKHDLPSQARPDSANET